MRYLKKLLNFPILTIKRNKIADYQINSDAMQCNARCLSPMSRKAVMRVTFVFKNRKLSENRSRHLLPDSRQIFKLFPFATKLREIGKFSPLKSGFDTKIRQVRCDCVLSAIRLGR